MLCDQHQICLERDVSLHRSGYLYHKIIPSRKARSSQLWFHTIAIWVLFICPQFENLRFSALCETSARFHDFTDAQFEGGFCSNREPHKHASWDTMHPACKSQIVPKADCISLKSFGSASLSTIVAPDRAFCLCYLSGPLLKTLYETCLHQVGLCCPLARLAFSSPCPPCLRCLHLLHAIPELVT